MADIMSLPEARPARLVQTSKLPRELVGRSTAIGRVQELVRRAAAADGGVLLVAHCGADVDSVAHALHERKGMSGRFERIDCGAAGSALLDELLFGPQPPLTASD